MAAMYYLKSWPQFFQAILKGEKKHDLRSMDRRFEVGDIVVLQEYDPFNGFYTGQELRATITFITSEDTPCAYSSAVLKRGYCILSLEVLPR